MLYHVMLKNDMCVSLIAEKFDFVMTTMCNFKDKKNNLIAMISKYDIVSISHFTDDLAENEVFDYENPRLKKGDLI